MGDSKADQSVDAISFVAFSVDRLKKKKCSPKINTSTTNAEPLTYHRPCSSKSTHK